MTMTMARPAVDIPLEVGSRVSIQPVSRKNQAKEGVAATIATVSGNRMLLRLSGSVPMPDLHKGDTVRIKYWSTAGGPIVYCWEAQLLHSPDVHQQSLQVALKDDGVTVQRRKSYRTSSPVIFSYTVIDAGESELIGERITDAISRNLSVGGLAFETDSQLAVGDILEMTLGVPSSSVTAVGWVIRARTGSAEGCSLVALEFLQMEVEDQRRLLEFLARSDPE